MLKFKIGSGIAVFLCIVFILRNTAILAVGEKNNIGIIGYVEHNIPVAILTLGKSDGLKKGDRIVVERSGYMIILDVEEHVSYGVPELLEEMPKKGDRVKPHDNFTPWEILNILRKKLPYKKDSWIKISHGYLLAYQNHKGHVAIRNILDNIRYHSLETKDNRKNKKVKGIHLTYLIIYQIDDILGLFSAEIPGIPTKTEDYHIIINSYGSQFDNAKLKQYQRNYLKNYTKTTKQDTIITNLKTMKQLQIKSGTPIGILECRDKEIKVRTILGVEGWIPKSCIEIRREKAEIEVNFKK